MNFFFICFVAILTHWSLVTVISRNFVNTGWSLVQVMAPCWTAPSHNLNQCWLIINETLWHWPEDNFTGNIQDVRKKYAFKYRTNKIKPHFTGVSELISAILLHSIYYRYLSSLWTKSLYELYSSYMDYFDISNPGSDCICFHSSVNCYLFISAGTLNFLSKFSVRINSLCPCDVIWQLISGSTLSQTMACCLINYPRQGPVTFIWGQFHKKYLSHESL